MRYDYVTEDGKTISQDTQDTREVYLGDGLYARYDGFALWLRAPREHGDHVVALEPQVLREFLRFAYSTNRGGAVIRTFIKEFGLNALGDALEDGDA